MSFIITGKILKGIGGIYLVLLENGQEVQASPRGILRKKSSPYPGDNVILDDSGDPDIPYRIAEILPRKNSILRPLITNIDALIILISASDPPPDYYFTEKMIILSLKACIEPVVFITKTDLAPGSAERIRKTYADAGFMTFAAGLNDNSDDRKLMEYIREKTVSFAGLSGTGKSTLFNRIIGSDHMEVGLVSIKNSKGRHTTRHSELKRFNGGFLADTPGFSSLEITDSGIFGNDVERAYPELLMISGKCRFAGCRHLGEKGCAVDSAQIDPGRYERYKYFRKQADSVPSHLVKIKNGGSCND